MYKGKHIANLFLEDGDEDKIKIAVIDDSLEAWY